MTFFEFRDKVKYYRDRYQIPVLFLFLGIVLLVTALSPAEVKLNNGETISVPQSSGFLYASLFFILASTVWFLYLFGIVKTFLGYGILAIMIVCSSWLIYADYMNIKTTVDFIADVEERDLEIKTRMDDIKQAQLAYKEMNGIYTNSMDDLIAFVKTGKKMKILKEGSIPERKITVEERDFLYGDDRPIDKLMTEVEATALAKSHFGTSDTSDFKGFKRDTSYVPVMDAIFLDQKRMDTREKIGGQFDFHPDSLRYVPFTRTEVKMDTSSIIRGEVKVPTLYFDMAHPMNDQFKEPIIYAIGDTLDNNLRESWKDR